MLGLRRSVVLALVGCNRRRRGERTVSAPPEYSELHTSLTMDSLSSLRSPSISSPSNILAKHSPPFPSSISPFANSNGISPTLAVCSLNTLASLRNPPNGIHSG